MAERKIGKGLTEKRANLVRLLEGHVAFLGVMAQMASWTPPPRPDRPPRGNEAFPYRQLTADRFWTPREKPSLRYPTPGAEALSDEQVAAWIAEDEFVRSGLKPKTARALAYIAVTFAPKHA